MVSVCGQLYLSVAVPWCSSASPEERGAGFECELQVGSARRASLTLNASCTKNCAEAVLVAVRKLCGSFAEAVRNLCGTCADHTAVNTPPVRASRPEEESFVLEGKALQQSGALAAE